MLCSLRMNAFPHLLTAFWLLMVLIAMFQLTELMVCSNFQFYQYSIYTVCVWCLWFVRFDSTVQVHFAGWVNTITASHYSTLKPSHVRKLEILLTAIRHHDLKCNNYKQAELNFFQKEEWCRKIWCAKKVQKVPYLPPVKDLCSFSDTLYKILQ